jgi:hypothetical protein
MCDALLPSEMQRALVVDDRIERQRVVMQQLAEMRHSASSLQERVAKLSGDVHPRMLGQVHEPSTPLLPCLHRSYCTACKHALKHCFTVCNEIYKEVLLMIRSS